MNFEGPVSSQASVPSLLPFVDHVHSRQLLFFQALAILIRRRPSQKLFRLVRSEKTKSCVCHNTTADEQARARCEVAVGLPERHCWVGLGNLLYFRPGCGYCLEKWYCSRILRGCGVVGDLCAVLMLVEMFAELKS